MRHLRPQTVAAGWSIGTAGHDCKKKLPLSKDSVSHDSGRDGGGGAGGGAAHLNLALLALLRC